MATYRILSLDGGGIRGVLTATILERIEKDSPGFISNINLFAGTSTGGILALGLAKGMTPTEARELYENLGMRVFKDSRWDNLWDITIPGLGPLKGAQYSDKPLREELEKVFGDMKLRDLPKNVMISSFDLDNKSKEPGKRNWKPKFFHNYESADSDGHEFVVDVALATAAAPTFFPIHNGFIDGGVIANNPSMCALAQALNKDTGKKSLRSLAMLSVGTGGNPRYLEAVQGDWGLVQWAPHLVSLIMEGSVNTAHYQCKQILGNRYMRINPTLPVPIGLDGIDQIETMRVIANEFELSEAFAFVKTNFMEEKKKVTP
jgi:patatin-like phospholipase/acyl hydrolase